MFIVMVPRNGAQYAYGPFNMFHEAQDWANEQSGLQGMARFIVELIDPSLE